MFIQAHFLTPFMQWLDVVELEFQPGHHSGTTISVCLFSVANI